MLFQFKFYLNTDQKRKQSRSVHDFTCCNKAYGQDMNSTFRTCGKRCRNKKRERENKPHLVIIIINTTKHNKNNDNSNTFVLRFIGQ